MEIQTLRHYPRVQWLLFPRWAGNLLTLEGRVAMIHHQYLSFLLIYPRNQLG